MEIPITFYLEGQKRPTYKKKLTVTPKTTLQEILTQVRETEIQVKMLPENRFWFRSPAKEKEYLLDKSTQIENIPFWERFGVDLCFMEQEEIESFISVAVSESNVEQIKTLIELEYIDANYELSKTDRNPRRNLLSIAASTSQPELLSYLLSQKANVNAINDLNDNALHSVVKFLRKESLVEEAVECITLLLEYGIDVNALGEYNNTALHWLCARGGIFAKKAMPLIIEKGADLSLKNDQSLSAMEYTEKYGNPECAKILEAYLPTPAQAKEPKDIQERMKQIEALIGLLLTQVLPTAETKVAEEMKQIAKKLEISIE